MTPDTCIRLGTREDGSEPSLPLDFITAAHAILAKRRVGKSYTASVISETLLDNQAQIAIFDPTGAWWGMKSSADGTQAGYDIAILGGLHADAPLDYRTGGAIAAALVQHKFSAILDLSEWDATEQVFFAVDFCRSLLRLNKTPLHVFFDEAQIFVPEHPSLKGHHGDFACRTAVRALVLQGGIKGIGSTLISQRPTLVSKDVLSQVDLMTALRMTHKADIKTVRDWMSTNVSEEFAEEVSKNQPGLAVGEAFIGAPHFGVAARVKIRTRRTFDSGRTPKFGEQVLMPDVSAQVDVAKLGSAIAASAAEAKANDPEELRAELRAALRRVTELEQNEGAGNMAELEDMIAGLRSNAASAIETLEVARADKSALVAIFNDFLFRQHASLAELERAIGDSSAAPAVGVTAPIRVAPVEVRPARPAQPPAEPSGDITPMGQGILNAMLELKTNFRIPDPSRAKIGLCANYSFTSGSFSTALGALSSAGLIETGRGLVVLTERGKSLAQPTAKRRPLDLVTGSKLFEVMEQEIAKVLLREPKRQFTRPEIAEATGYSHTSGSFSTAIGKLSTYEFIVTGRGSVQAAGWLSA